jgi:hypothetical protein
MALDDPAGDSPRENSGRKRRLWPFLIPIVIIVVALLGTVFFPFVNRSTLWFGLPSVGVWSALWVLAIAPALALVEHLGGYARIDDARIENARIDGARGDGAEGDAQ